MVPTTPMIPGQRNRPCPRLRRPDDAATLGTGAEDELELPLSNAAELDGGEAPCVESLAGAEDAVEPPEPPAAAAPPTIRWLRQPINA